MPEFQYWTSVAGAAVLASWTLFMLAGLGASRRYRWPLATSGTIVALFAVWSIARQAEVADQQSHELLEATNRSLFPKTPTPPPLPADAPPWMKVAYKELGQAEISGVEENARITEYFATVAGTNTYREDGDDWASAFVEWSLQHAGKTGPKNMKPSAWLTWGQPLETPQFGAIVILDFSGHEHVGFFFGEEGDFVKVLGGDQNESVSIYLYPKSAVQGYRRPS
jgi:uncharacterized protein (TIGR02594 family)